MTLLCRPAVTKLGDRPVLALRHCSLPSQPGPTSNLSGGPHTAAGSQARPACPCRSLCLASWRWQARCWILGQEPDHGFGMAQIRPSYRQPGRGLVPGAAGGHLHGAQAQDAPAAACLPEQPHRWLCAHACSVVAAAVPDADARRCRAGGGPVRHAQVHQAAPRRRHSQPCAQVLPRSGRLRQGAWPGPQRRRVGL